VEDGIDLVLGQDALDQAPVAQVAEDGRAAAPGGAGVEEALRDEVAHERDDVRAAGHERLAQPRAEQAGGARDEDGAVGPERVRGDGHAAGGSLHACPIGGTTRELEGRPRARGNG
jgi:hypothetical protein